MAGRITKEIARQMQKKGAATRKKSRIYLNRSMADVVNAITAASTPEIVQAAVTRLWKQHPSVMIGFIAKVIPKSVRLDTNPNNGAPIVINMPEFKALPHETDNNIAKTGNNNDIIDVSSSNTDNNNDD